MLKKIFFPAQLQAAKRYLSSGKEILKNTIELSWADLIITGKGLDFCQQN